MSFGAGCRVYYGRLRDDVVVLLGGSDKGDQASEIINSQQLWADFQKQGLADAALADWIEYESEQDADEA